MNRKLLRRVLVASGIVALACLIVLTVLKLYLDSTYFDGYDPAAPLDVQKPEQAAASTNPWRKFSFMGARGCRVPAVIALPQNRQGPFPCVVFLHGIGDNKNFMQKHGLDQPFLQAGYAMVCADQLSRGERKLPDKSPLKSAEAFRVRAACTVIDTRRLIDYLCTRGDIETNRIYLVGASYGAIVGATTAAFDERIRATVLIYGGGNLRKLLSAEMIRNDLGRWSPLANLAAWYFAGVWDPVHYVGRISPRPVLLQNGKADTLVAPAAAVALQQAAREPKRILWYAGDHLGKTSDLEVKRAHEVLQDALAFLEETDRRITGEPKVTMPGAPGVSVPD